MKSVHLVLLILQTAAAAASAVSATRCPSWFDEIGQRYLDATPELPGIQLSISAPQDGIECRGSWISALDFFKTSPPLLIDAPYRLASITKSFTSVTTLKLVERGIIEVNGSVIDYLPSWASELLIETQGAENASQITPWMLMQHTSGLDDFVRAPGYLDQWLENQDYEQSLEALLTWSRDHLGPVAPPGTVVHYSDLGFAYLGTVVSHMTGLSLGAAVREAVQMDKLGMDSTWWEIFEETPEGTTPRAGQWMMGVIDVTNFHASGLLYGGAGLISNSDDLVKFARATHKGHILGKEVMEMMYTTLPMNSTVDPEIGLGWMHNVIGGLETWYHRGGFGTFMYYFPERDLAITGAINQESQLRLMPVFVADVLDHVLGESKSHRRRRG